VADDMAAPSAFVCSVVRYFTKIMLPPACLIMSVGREAGIDGGGQVWECRKKREEAVLWSDGSSRARFGPKKGEIGVKNGVGRKKTGKYYKKTPKKFGV